MKEAYITRNNDNTYNIKITDTDIPESSINILQGITSLRLAQDVTASLNAEQYQEEEYEENSSNSAKNGVGKSRERPV